MPFWSVGGTKGSAVAVGIGMLVIGVAVATGMLVVGLAIGIGAAVAVGIGILLGKAYLKRRILKAIPAPAVAKAVLRRKS